MYWGPHHKSSGKRLASKKLTAIRRLCDQLSTRPSGVVAQSRERIRDPISLWRPGSECPFPPSEGLMTEGIAAPVARLPNAGEASSCPSPDKSIPQPPLLIEQ